MGGNGDGRRVRQIGPGGEVTLYLGGGAYEVRDATGDAEVVKYYGIAGQRVALNGLEGLQYLLTDHLGSVSAVLDATGNLLAEQRYTPFGEVRFDVTLGTTDFGYTGQRALADTGLMDYNARFYAPALGRFMQPDNIVPKITHPHDLNRFTYSINNPVRYSDPSGNTYCDSLFSCSDDRILRRSISPINYVSLLRPVVTQTPSSVPNVRLVATNTTPTLTPTPQPTSQPSSQSAFVQQPVSSSVIVPQHTPNPNTVVGLEECSYPPTGICKLQSPYYEWRYEYEYRGSMIPVVDLGIKVGVAAAAAVSVRTLNPAPFAVARAVDESWGMVVPLLDPSRAAEAVAQQQMPSSPQDYPVFWLIAVGSDLHEIAEGIEITGMSGPYRSPIPIPNP